jgi:hypothetical protein
MTTRTEKQIDAAALAAIKAADEARFWELAAVYGYHRPAVIDPDQAWFWTRAWVTGELEVDLAIAEGRTTFYASDEEFLASFDEEDLRTADVREE